MELEEREQDMKKIPEEQDIVIVGGGICGLATALALHRKGIGSLVLERSETLRAAGVGIIVQPNGWRALDHLGVASKLRDTALDIRSLQLMTLKDGKSLEVPFRKGEVRYLKRMDLIEALAEPLSENTVHFGCEVLSITLDPVTFCPILQLHDGSIIKAKIVIGCDGLNSVISKFLSMNSPQLFTRCATRGFTCYQRGHNLAHVFHIHTTDNVQLGQLPVTDKLVYWFLTRSSTPRDSTASKKGPTYIKEASMEAMKGFGHEALEMIKESQDKSLHLTELRYRTPWELLQAKFRRGTVVVAGDAMHAMCPFIGQGGGASLEDAVVLARCLSQTIKMITKTDNQKMVVEQALDMYVKERRMRLFWLSLQNYLIGMTLDSTSKMKKMLAVLGLNLIFRDQRGHSEYDCGHL